MTARRCDQCGKPADSVHILPGPSRAERVELACPDHDPSGYWFYIERWFTGPPDWRDKTRRDTVRDHILDTKRNGWRAVALVEERLGLVTPGVRLPPKRAIEDERDRPSGPLCVRSASIFSPDGTVRP